MKTSVPKTIKIEEYKEPAYEVLNAYLTFELDSANTKVTADVNYCLKEGKTSEPLVLDGEEIKLGSIEVDGEVLPEDAYELTSETLTIFSPKEKFNLKIVNFINPEANKALEGLYKSGSMFCTQCEAEGFRRITYFMDRPDVMTTYKTKIIADKKEYPVLLSNGNPISSGDLDGGKHFVEWEDPFKKPTYLFALVGGDLGVVKGTYKTMSGRDVELRVYCDKGNEDKCDYTIESLIESMKWDEYRWGLEYDLDIYMIVAVDSFNMGAMENKGLNIFNSKYVLATPETATDSTYASIQGIVGHEYFHNWTGNRVTCRDWFQLTLKEGLTVFRDQEFSSDLNSRPAVRVENMNGLKVAQFVEDAGPNAHPIKPKAYMDINNFYTSTVYSKGSEVIRMYHTLLGEEGFRKGIDKYFELFDGMAVTTEDFLHAMSVANNDYDFSHFSKWYDQAGTPLLKISGEYNESEKTYSLAVKQINKPTSGQPDKIPLFMPFKLGLIASNGNDMALELDGTHPQLSEGIVHISKDQETFTFKNVIEKPILSLNRDFSAPVNIDFNYSEDDLAFLMAYDSDLVARYSACQMLFEKVVLDRIEAIKSGKEYTPSDLFFSSIEKAFADLEFENEIKASSLSLPSPAIIAQKFEVIDYVAIQDALDFVKQSIIDKCRETLVSLYKGLDLSGPYVFSPENVGVRSMANVLADYLTLSSNEADIDLVYGQYKSANNMTSKLGAFSALSKNGTKYADEVSEDFYQSNKHFDSSLQEWMRVMSRGTSDGALDRLEKVMSIKEFNITIPNHVYSSIRVFAANFKNFHAEDGSGYKFVADKVIEIDKLNSQVAAGLATSFKQYKYLSDSQKNLMASELKRIKSTDGLTKGTYEIIEKTLNA